MTHEGAPAVFVIHEVAAVRPSCLRGCGRIADNISDSSEYYLGLLIPRIARRLTSTTSIVVPFN